MSGGCKHLVRAARQGGVVVLMSRYVRRLYVHLCVQPVKVASRCPDVTCTMGLPYGYISLFKAVVSQEGGSLKRGRGVFSRGARRTGRRGREGPGTRLAAGRGAAPAGRDSRPAPVTGTPDTNSKEYRCR